VEGAAALKAAMDTSPVTAGTRTRDLRTETASLRIDGDRRDDRLRLSRFGGQVPLWMVPAVLLTAALAGWWWLTRSRVLTVQMMTLTMRAPDAADQAVLTASGYVTARRRATVSSRVTGKLSAVLVDAGMPVREGQVLAHLDDSVAHAAIGIADAQLAAARSELGEIEVRLREAQANQGRQRRLAAAGLVSAAELDTTSAAVDALTARLAAAASAVSVAAKQLALRRVELADTILRAPFDGVVISKDAQAGEMVSPTSAGGGFTRTGVCTIVDMSSREIALDVNEAHINRVAPGQRVAALLDAYPGTPFHGRVVATVPAADRQKATVQVRIAVDEVDPRMLPDMTVKVSFLQESKQSQTAASARPPLLVPRRAVRLDDGQDVVFVVRDGRAERRVVRLGTHEGDQVEIQSGLSSGDRIIVEGPNDLTHNARVKEDSAR
jgi:RND family efflux transporter MFP subunit